MRRFAVLCVLSIFAATTGALPPANVPAAGAVVAAPGLPPVPPAAPATPPPPPTLSTDIEELYRLIPFAPLNKLVLRYLINDPEFQAFVRIINTNDAFMLRMRLQTQPEWIAFQQWVRTQLMLSGGGSLEFEESEELLTLFNPTPYWAVYGWQGFFNEFQAYYPQAMIRAHIDAKIMQGGSFAQFWARLKGLQPLYERVLVFPETQRIIAQLQANGVDTAQLDQFIRAQFDWVQLPAPVAPAPAVVAPAPAPAPAPAAPPAPATV